MPKRKRKKYKRPKKLYDSVRIQEENNLVKKYGLKNKREIWRADFAIAKIRSIAKKLITASEGEKNAFIEKQRERGLNVKSIADILGLNKEDYLKRRLQSVLFIKGIAKTPRQARQFIIHKHVLINGNKIDAPSHVTTLKEETGISLGLAIPVEKTQNKNEEEQSNKVVKQEGENE